MDIQALSVFAAVARTLSFSEVARQRHLAPSSISRTIMSLEQELGVKLVERTTRRLTLTEAGLRFLNSIEGVVDTVETAAAQARDAVAKPAGIVRVTMSSAFAAEVMVPLLPHFRAEFPDIELEIVSADQPLDLLRNGLDLAIRHGPQSDSGLVARRLVQTRYCVMASPAWCEQQGPLSSPAQLSEVEVCRYAIPGFRETWQWADRNEKLHSVAVQGSCQFNSALAVRAAAEHGLGPALLAEWLAAPSRIAGRLVELFPDLRFWGSDPNPCIWLVIPSRRSIPMRVRCFAEFLQAKLMSA